MEARRSRAAARAGSHRRLSVSGTASSAAPPSAFDLLAQPQAQRARAALAVRTPSSAALAPEAARAVGRQRLDDQARVARRRAGRRRRWRCGRSLPAPPARRARRRRPGRSGAWRRAGRARARRRPRLADLDGQRALARRRRRFDRIDAARATGRPRPSRFSPASGQDDGVGLAGVQLGQAGVDVAAQQDDAAGRAGGAGPGPGGAGWRCRAARPAAGRRAMRRSWLTKASRGSSRSGMAAMTRPAGARPACPSASGRRSRCGRPAAPPRSPW